jgi:hypothetical protein
MGGSIEGSDFSILCVDEQFVYKRSIYKAMDLFEDLVNFTCQNRFERLLFSFLLDQRYMELFASNFESGCGFLDLNDLNARTNEISTLLGWGESVDWELQIAPN